MQAKFSVSFKVDDNTGNTTSFNSVDVYINSLNEQNLEPLKDGITSLCDGMVDIINETEGGGNENER